MLDEINRFVVVFIIDGLEQRAFCDSRDQAINCAEAIKETTRATGVEIREVKHESQSQ